MTTFTLALERTPSNTAATISNRGAVASRPGDRNNAPVVSVPADQVYYWTRFWQDNEQAALQELAAGEGRSFDEPGAAVRWLLSEDD